MPNVASSAFRISKIYIILTILGCYPDCEYCTSDSWEQAFIRLEQATFAIVLHCTLQLVVKHGAKTQPTCL